MDDGLNSLQYFLQQKFLANCYCFWKIHVLESLGFLQGSVKAVQLGKSCCGSIVREQRSNSVVNLSVKDYAGCEAVKSFLCDLYTGKTYCVVDFPCKLFK